MWTLNGLRITELNFQEGLKRLWQGDGMAAKAGKREILAQGVVRWPGMDNPLGNTMAIVKYVRKSLIIIFVF